MKLRGSIPKHRGIGRHREVSSEQTWERMRPHHRRVGITRVADITGLDRVGIPVWNAVVPRSADELSVYNGKGGTPMDAKTSAVMEAVERFCAWQPMRPIRIASYAELCAEGVAALDPATHNLRAHRTWSPDRPVSWVRGVDLLAEREVLVPLSLAGYYVRYGDQPVFQITSTNGIASGNSVEEAICHALIEVIERDSWTLAELVGHRLKSVVRTRLARQVGPGAADWLEDRHPLVDPATLPPVPQRYAEMILDAGLRLVIRDATSPLGIPTFGAMVAEDLGPAVAQGHAGYGTHPDAEVAVVRALTEAAQSRAVDLQAVREDLALPREDVPRWRQQTYRGAEVDLAAWPFGAERGLRSFADVPNHSSDDLATDIELLVGRLREHGLGQVIVVDLSVPDVPASVVRVVVPGLESYAFDQSRLGARASAHWDAHIRALISQRDTMTAGATR
jgi:ribosomal protein S12 methylthiotransferase accessory factor